MSATEVSSPPDPGVKPTESGPLLSGILLTALGVIGIVAGVLFSIVAPQLRPVPAVFLAFWLAMVFVGKIFFSGLTRLREAGRSAPAPEQVRAAAAVIAVIAATSFAGAFLGVGSSWATCPGDATCPPGPGPQLTFTPPAQQQTTAPGQQGPQPGQQDNNGIATSPAQGGSNNGGNIQAQTPEFGTPGQQAPTVPGNEPDQPPQGTAPARPTAQQQQPEVRTTAPGLPTAATTTPRRPRIDPDSSTSSRNTTSTRPASASSAPQRGGRDFANDDDGEDPPMWAFLVNESTAVLTGRRLRTGSSGTKVVRSGQTVSNTQTVFLRTSANRVIPGRAVDKPVTGTPTTGDGLPNPDHRTAFRLPQTASQKQAQRNIDNTPGSAAQEWARKLWRAMKGQPNPWYPNGDPIDGEEDINADRIIPKRTLSNYIGFDTLPEKVQRSIADMKENIWPVPGSINKANVDKPKTRWVYKGGAPLPPEILAEAIRKSDSADKAVRSRIIQELLKNQASLIALLKQLGYSDEEIAAFLSLSQKAQQALLEQITNGQRPPLKVGTVPATGKDGKELVPAPSKATPGEHEGQAQGVFDVPPFGPDHKLHASDFFKDGWEPPVAVSQARDKAIDALWTALQNSNGMVTTPELDQAWHDYNAINNVYQGLVQQHWAEIGRPGGKVPEVPAICIPANVVKV